MALKLIKEMFSFLLVMQVTKRNIKFLLVMQKRVQHPKDRVKGPLKFLSEILRLHPGMLIHS